MLRSIASIAAGFLLIGVLSMGADVVMLSAAPWAFSPAGRVDHPGILLAILGYVSAFAVAGCYLTGLLAGRRPMLHAMILGAIGLALNIVGTIAKWDIAPAWYHVVAVLMVLPLAWIGGWLAERTAGAENVVEPA